MKGRVINNPMYTTSVGGGGGGYTRFQLTRMIEGRKVIKFGKYFAGTGGGGWLDLIRDFWLFRTI